MAGTCDASLRKRFALSTLADEGSRMMRKLSGALISDRPSISKVHPSTADDDAAVGDLEAFQAAAAIAAQDAAEAADNGIAEAGGAADGIAQDAIDITVARQPGSDEVTILVQQDDSPSQAAAAVVAEPGPSPRPQLPYTQPPAVAVTAAAGNAAAAAGLARAAAAAVGGGSAAADGGTPIAAHKRRGMRISFADVAGVSPLAEYAAAKPPPLQPPSPGIASLPGPRRSINRASLITIPIYQPNRGRHHSEETTGSDRKSSVFDLLDRRSSKPQARWRAGLSRFLQSGGALLTSLILTILILYSDSLRQACMPKSADPFFLAFTIFVMVVFTLEASASCLANPRYFKTFYFWVDVVSTLSIMLDIPAILDPIINSPNDGNGDYQQRSGLENAASITAASTRAARLAHVTKWMRLWRIMRLWAFYFKHKAYIIDRKTFFEAELEASSQSRLGEKLTELTIRKVVVMVLLVMFAMPVFDLSVGYYGGPPLLDNGGLDMLHAAYGASGNSSAFQAVMQVYTAETPYRLGRGHTGKMTDLVVFNQSFISVPGGVEGLRPSEYANYTAMTGPGCNGGSGGTCDVSFATYNLLWDSQIQGYLEIGRTTFIIIILLVGAVWFIADTDRLVLRPLERMVQLVKEVSENPLAKISRLSRVSSTDMSKQQKALETQVLESSIQKICSLLSVGFGEAGAEVIADNIKSGGDLNPMIPGRKVAAIFGFCDIRSFTDATEVLQEDVMEFVNSIAQIVHHEVSLHGGAANKNIGDAFLLVWKLPGSRREPGRGSVHPGSSLARTRSQGSGMSRMSRASSSARLSMLMGCDREPERKEEASNIADQALASFIIIQAALKRSQKLKEFCNRDDLSQRLPGYQVNMGFGLHVGWAIEGAIGSEHKIDASYLSPHVNMASRLEAATKQYGASILLSEDFYRMLSPGIRSLVRQIDCVTVKGSNKPIGLYTYDVDVTRLDALKLGHQKMLMRITSTLSNSSVAEDAAAAAAAVDGSAAGQAVESDGARLACYETFSGRKYADEFAEHPDIVMTRAVDEEFLSRFKEGFEAYRAGDWAAARDVLLETVSMRRNKEDFPVQDGPSATLLRVMAGHDFRAPSNWAGYRELTEK